MISALQDSGLRPSRLLSRCGEECVGRLRRHGPRECESADHFRYSGRCKFLRVRTTKLSQSLGLMVLHVSKLLLPYLAAAFVYPDQIPEDGRVDLLAHYDRTRAFAYGALIAGLITSCSSWPARDG